MRKAKRKSNKVKRSLRSEYGGSLPVSSSLLFLVVHLLDDGDDDDDGPAEAHSKIYCRQLEVRHEFYLFACKSDLCDPKDVRA